ncbi:hypothetical protein JCM8547_001191 [Rhodosporidiobolus lusitaniae]
MTACVRVAVPFEITVKGLLFDMDGTLVDSTPAVEKTMGDWCHEQGIEPSEFFQHSHGVRTQDNIKRFQTKPVPGTSLSEEELTESVNKLEFLIAENGRKLHEAGGKGIERLPGVSELLTALRDGKARWGICTSATRIYANSALKTGEIGSEPPLLPFLITANDVVNGKPNPDPYLKGMDELRKIAPGDDFKPENILVVEDAPSGLKAGCAAGCKTLAVATGQPIERVRTFEATVKAFDLTRVEVLSASPESVTLRIHTLEEDDEAGLTSSSASSSELAKSTGDSIPAAAEEIAPSADKPAAVKEDGAAEKEVEKAEEKKVEANSEKNGDSSVEEKQGEEEITGTKRAAEGDEPEAKKAKTTADEEKTAADGTLVDSTPAVEKTLGDWCRGQGIEPSEFFQHSHGVRMRDTIKRFQTKPVLGTSLSEEELTKSVDEVEFIVAETGRKLHEAGGKGIERLPGVSELLTALRNGNARWGICTSSTRIYANSALTTGEIGFEPPLLPFLITANDVVNGKPNPDPYLKGMDELRKIAPGDDFKPEDILVVEDAPSGLKAGFAAGCKTLAVATGQPIERVRTFDATVKAFDLTRVEVFSASPESVTLRIHTLEDDVAGLTSSSASSSQPAKSTGDSTPATAEEIAPSAEKPAAVKEDNGADKEVEKAEDKKVEANGDVAAE